MLLDKNKVQDLFSELFCLFVALLAIDFFFHGNFFGLNIVTILVYYRNSPILDCFTMN